MLTIDGSRGEGGGQVLRSSLAMAMVIGQPVRIENIRAGRTRPGLLRQHLTAARAAAQISSGWLDGDVIGSTVLTLHPGTTITGEHRFSIGTAGSTILVLQTVLPALITANGPSTLVLEGGTHNPNAPPFEFLARAFLPLLAALGPQVIATLEKAGFAPAGGGRLRVEVTPAPLQRNLSLLSAGNVVAQRVEVVLSNLPRHIAEREIATISSATGWDRDHASVRHEPSPGPGNVILIEVVRPEVTEIISAFGERGISAEAIAGRALRDLQRYLAADVPVGEHLADQLILPLAMAGGGSFATLPLSGHTTTQIALVQQILGTPITVEKESPTRSVVHVG